MVEHASQDEPRGGSDLHTGLLVIGGAHGRQVAEHGPLGLDALGAVGIGAPDNPGDEDTIAVEIVEVGRAA